MAYADWSEDDYEQFHDAAFLEIFNHFDLEDLSDEEIERAEELFEAGWLNFNISEIEREQYREDFYEVMNMRWTSQDWEEFRELYNATDG